MPPKTKDLEFRILNPISRVYKMGKYTIIIQEKISMYTWCQVIVLVRN